MKDELGLTRFVKHTGRFDGIYRAKVEDNNDPSMFGRIRARVYPMFADITPIDVLPWTVPAYPIFEGAGFGDNGYSGYSAYSGYSGHGTFSVPKIGTFVFVFFEEGDIYQPVYFAEAQTAQFGLPVSRISHYPNVKVWRTLSGMEFVVDSTPLSESITITHPSGTSVSIQPNGSILVNSTNIIIISGTQVRINPI